MIYAKIYPIADADSATVPIVSSMFAHTNTHTQTHTNTHTTTHTNTHKTTCKHGRYNRYGGGICVSNWINKNKSLELKT